MNNKIRKLLLRMGLVVIVAAVTGCAGIGAQWNLPPEEAVRLRAQAWADDLMAGDIEGAWALTSPTYRQFSTWKQYYTFVQGSGRWTSATVDSVQCVEDVCDVRLMIEYDIKRMNMTNRRPLDYKWVKVDGDWWLHVPAK